LRFTTLLLRRNSAMAGHTSCAVSTERFSFATCLNRCTKPGHARVTYQKYCSSQLRLLPTESCKSSLRHVWQCCVSRTDIRRTSRSLHTAAGLDCSRSRANASRETLFLCRPIESRNLHTSCTKTSPQQTDPPASRVISELPA
jgi:hypothetical protein